MIRCVAGAASACHETIEASHNQPCDGVIISRVEVSSRPVGDASISDAGSICEVNADGKARSIRTSAKNVVLKN